ncbi:hypothetical protein HanPI659440_Chr11g0425401 [Helianthus annuus]|nr:hypothetical protein HanPI659440_Chr11g0425401 [Helianthus annuus]
MSRLGSGRFYKQVKPQLGLFATLTLCPLSYYYQRHPVNYLLLGIFTISLAFAVGLTCAFTNGKSMVNNVIKKCMLCFVLQI